MRNSHSSRAATAQRSAVQWVSGGALVAVLAMASWVSPARAALPIDRPVPSAAATDRLIVKYRDATGSGASSQMSAARLQALQMAAQGGGVQLAHLRSMASGASVLKLSRRLGNAEAAQLAAAMAKVDPQIEFVEPDLMMRPQFAPNDSLYASQWPLYEATGGIRAQQAWDVSTGQGVVVAVIDTGYRPHADLVGNIVGGHDFIGDAFVGNDGDGRDADAQDPGDAEAANECGAGLPAQSSSWHGTHVAGTIAATANNNAGVAGVAFGAKVLPSRVLGKCGGYTSDIADAVVWASGGTVAGVPVNAYPARVLNLSLGGGGSCGATMQAAIDSALSRQAVVVVAAGNSNASANNASPANCKGVVTVAATNRYGERAAYSNYGSVVALAAPGGEMNGSPSNGVLSTLNNGSAAPAQDSYAYYQGTSMATPHVAGVAALMLSKNPALTADQVVQLLKSTARAFPGSCVGCGAGIVDAEAAVKAAAGGGGTVASPTGESEPNDTLATANPVAAPTTLSASMASGTDQDWFVVDLPAGATITASMTPNAASDYELAAYAASGNLITKRPRGKGMKETMSIVNKGSAAVKCYFQVRFISGTQGANGGAYELALSW